jgi:hypothetical protein
MTESQMSMTAKRSAEVLLAVLILGSVTPIARAQDVPLTTPRPTAGQAPGKISQPTTIRKAFVSFRIGVPQWMPQQRYEEVLALFEKYKGVTDEITFFTSATHPPLPLPEIQRRTRVLAERIVRARQLGYRAGINVLSTIGHHNENLANSLSGDYTRLTDIDGNVCQGAFCPNDPRVQQYVRQVYEAVAAADPDYVWVDDDVRLAGHKPIFQTCFCDTCLAVFAKQTGREWTRPALKAAFAADSQLALRKAWLAHNRQTIGRLLGLIEQTVHRVKPGLPLGFMTGDRFYEGYDFDNWARALAGPSRAEVRWRPGGGFYEDENTAGLAGKSHDVGRQVAMLPPEVVSIQSEIENFPYQRLKKSAHITVLEAASHIAAGCTGAAFNVLSMYDEPLGEDEFEPLVARIRQSRPFFDLLAGNLGRKPLAGIHSAWNKDSHLAASHPSLPTRMLEIGLPVDYSPRGSSVILLEGAAMAAFNKEDILRMLASGVYMDGEALKNLNAMGCEDLTGFELERTVADDCVEKLTDHPLNGRFVGRERDCRQSFYAGPAYILKKRDPKAEILAKVVDYAGREVGPATMGLFENRLGGRVCVAGYFPWTSVHNLSKSTQVKSVMRWLSRDRLPAYVDSFHKINLWAREPSQGNVVLAMTNSSHDAAQSVAIMLLTEKSEIRVYDMDCRETRVVSSGGDGPYRKFVIPMIDPWQMRLIVAR